MGLQAELSVGDDVIDDAEICIMWELLKKGIVLERV